ncbi:MAG TPA: endonuclease/exonuclease/phosphatase family protein [Myxococcales bacterium]|jgi:endonuclease/exonuclease/phosphatase family metal-dependent hydrolase|nr:endonuclease/exonuclease/phosphatase family protein [Myxococcales bacterium]
MRRELRFVSWNIHGALGTDGRRDLNRIAEVLEASGCDAAALQEVGDPRSSGETADHASWLGERLGWYVAYGPNLVLAGRPYGNAILSRFPISSARNYDLSVEGREPRGCLRADLVLPSGGALHFFDLHLGLSFGERRKQAARLLSAELLRDSKLTAPLVLCGDFNLWSPLPGPIVRILRRSLRDAAQELRRRKPTWPSRRPLLRLDRTYVDDGVSLLACGVVNDPRARVASDHLPLWVDLEPKGDAPALAAGKAGA